MKTRLITFLLAISHLLLSNPVHYNETTSRVSPDLPNSNSGFRQIELSDGWKIKMLKPTEKLVYEKLEASWNNDRDTTWIKALKMPAMIPDILLQNKRIETPWLPGKAKEYMWIAENDWIYLTQFHQEDQFQESFLVFQGLDGIVDVYLNGKKIASHSNMFLPLRINVTGRLRNENKLLLHFKSLFEQREGKPMPIMNIKGNPDRPVRRPKWNYNNYLGPKPYFSRVGVFDKICLEITNGSRITELLVASSLNDSLNNASLILNIIGESNRKDITLRITLSGPDKKEYYSKLIPLKVQNGIYEQKLDFDVPDPELWWPRGYGGQPLYSLKASLLVDGVLHHTVTKTLGFRKVTMPDTLQFEVNGIPVKWWGANWITPHWHTAVWDQVRAEKLFDMAENANFNAFRAHGTGGAPMNEFYEMADKKGFMIWQDFPSLPLSPDEKSIEICKSEASFLLKRLKHHPSIFLWCGGNEGAMWHNQEFNPQLKDLGNWPGIEAAAEVARVCQQLDPDRFFMPNTPYYGIDPNDPAKGSTHGYTSYWFVPGFDYLNFASEDNRIAAPTLKSLKRFMAPDDIWPENYSNVYPFGKKYSFPETWLPYTSSVSWKKTGPVELFYDATDASSLVHRLGMAEALYYKETIERLRRGRTATDTSNNRNCYGYLVWKYNDSWPQIYSGKIDYFLEPYHAYYELRRAYAPIILSFDFDNYCYLWAVNDSPDTVSGKITIQFFHLARNEVRKEIIRDVMIPPGHSKVIIRLDQAGIGTFLREHILSATLIDKGGNTIANTCAYGAIERQMEFPDAKLEAEIKNGTLVLKSDKFARCIYIEGDDDGDEFGWFFEDNYFDLMPGVEKTIKIRGDHKEGVIKVKAWYSPFITQVKWRSGN